MSGEAAAKRANMAVCRLRWRAIDTFDLRRGMGRRDPDDAI